MRPLLRPLSLAHLILFIWTSPPRPRPSNAVDLTEVDYGPPRLGSVPSRCVNDNLDQLISIAKEPSRLPSTKPKTKLKKHSYSHTQHDIDPNSTSEQYSDQSDDPQPVSSRPKKHADKTKHKTRSRCPLFYRGGSVLCS